MKITIEFERKKDLKEPCKTKTEAKEQLEKEICSQIKMLDKPYIFITEPETVELVKHCLNYCWHRGTQHCGNPMNLCVDKVDKLRKALNK
jgi:hypothetical protein